MTIPSWALPYPLADRDILMAEAIAAGREREKGGWDSARPWRQDTHFCGLLGELTWSRLTGHPMDLEHRRHGSRKVNAVLPDGRAVDIMTTTYYAHALLKEEPTRRLWPDLFVLVGLDQTNRRGWLLGQLTPAELIRRDRRRDFGYGERLYEEAINLWPIDHALPTVSPITPRPDRPAPMRQATLF